MTITISLAISLLSQLSAPIYHTTGYVKPFYIPNLTQNRLLQHNVGSNWPFLLSLPHAFPRQRQRFSRRRLSFCSFRHPTPHHHPITEQTHFDFPTQEHFIQRSSLHHTQNIRYFNLLMQSLRTSTPLSTILQNLPMPSVWLRYRIKTSIQYQPIARPLQITEHGPH